MAELKLAYTQVQGFPYVKIEGDLTKNSFAALHLVVRGATKFGTVTVIVDLRGEVHISDEVKEVKCWRYPTEIPEYATRVALLLISSTERIEELETLLIPHKLQHVESVEGAIDILNKTAGGPV